jgi:hypothetical protein
MTDAHRRRLIVDLSKHYHILSKETTLIAIEHRTLEERTTGKPAQRRIPVMLAKGWGGSEECSGELYEMACAPEQVPAPPPAAAPAPRKRGFFKLFHRTAVMDHLQEEETRTEPTSDPLQQLLMRQTAEGWFDHDNLLDAPQIAGKPWNPAECRAKVQAIPSLPEKLRQQILDTALTLRALHDCFPDQKDLWTLAAKKALRWLKRNAPEVADLLNNVASASSQ